MHFLPKAYDLINSSISHWDFAAADKVKALFHKYYEIIFQLECFKMSQAKFEEGVDRIIRLRNRTTHVVISEVFPVKMPWWL